MAYIANVKKEVDVYFGNVRLNFRLEKGKKLGEVTKIKILAEVYEGKVITATREELLKEKPLIFVHGMSFDYARLLSSYFQETELKDTFDDRFIDDVYQMVRAELASRGHELMKEIREPISKSLKDFIPHRI